MLIEIFRFDTFGGMMWCVGVAMQIRIQLRQDLQQLQHATRLRQIRPPTARGKGEVDLSFHADTPIAAKEPGCLVGLHPRGQPSRTLAFY